MITTKRNKGSRIVHNGIISENSNVIDIKLKCLTEPNFKYKRVREICIGIIATGTAQLIVGSENSA
jgi:hypothetical protein